MVDAGLFLSDSSHSWIQIDHSGGGRFLCLNASQMSKPCVLTRFPLNSSGSFWTMDAAMINVCTIRSQKMGTCLKENREPHKTQILASLPILKPNQNITQYFMLHSLGIHRIWTVPTAKFSTPTCAGPPVWKQTNTKELKEQWEQCYLYHKYANLHSNFEPRTACLVLGFRFGLCFGMSFTFLSSPTRLGFGLCLSLWKHWPVTSVWRGYMGTG